jgi:hypothetical protein
MVESTVLGGIPYYIVCKISFGGLTCVLLG